MPRSVCLAALAFALIPSPAVANAICQQVRDANGATIFVHCVDYDGPVFCRSFLLGYVVVTACAPQL